MAVISPSCADRHAPGRCRDDHHLGLASAGPQRRMVRWRIGRGTAGRTRSGARTGDRLRAWRRLDARGRRCSCRRRRPEHARRAGVFAAPRARRNRTTCPGLSCSRSTPRRGVLRDAIPRRALATIAAGCVAASTQSWDVRHSATCRRRQGPVGRYDARQQLGTCRRFDGLREGDRPHDGLQPPHDRGPRSIRGRSTATGCYRARARAAGTCSPATRRAVTAPMSVIRDRRRTARSRRPARGILRPYVSSPRCACALRRHLHRASRGPPPAPSGAGAGRSASASTR